MRTVMMNLCHQALVVTELCRLESLGYIGLLGIRYLSDHLTTPDPETGYRVRAVNLAPAKGWAIAACGPRGEELRHKFLRDIEGQWQYHGLEKREEIGNLCSKEMKMRAFE